MSILDGFPAAAAGRARQRLADWQEARVSRRLWERDFTLWQRDNGTEISDRLGWLEAPSRISDIAEAAAALAAEVRGAGIRQVVLLGMGGSSLAPEVFRSVLGRAEGYPELVVLDSTHPDAVRRVLSTTEAAETLAIVASKSGSTIETMSLFQVFWQRAAAELEAPGVQFVAITDPGTSLAELAADRDFRRTFAADPNVGGRYSALTAFGIVPAALIGADLGALQRNASRMAERCGADVEATEHPGLALAAAIVEATLAGRDKLTLLTSDLWSALPIWVEQLVAESLGKDGRGVVPVAEESGGEIDWGNDRCFAVLRTSADDRLARQVTELRETGHPVVEWVVDDPLEIGAEMYRWEFGVGAAGIGIGVHPFDQPDVQIAKKLANEAMAGGGASGGAAPPWLDVEATDLVAARDAWLDGLMPGEYLGIQAYVPASPGVEALLERLRRGLRDRHGVAVTTGYGPRFLHSTGQLHKGGANIGRFLQIFSRPQTDVEVPTTDYSLARLIRAQADGDAGALAGRERQLLRIEIGDRGLESLVETLTS